MIKDLELRRAPGVPHVAYIVRFKNGGQVPKALEGTFNSERLGQQAIDFYLRERDNGEKSKARRRPSKQGVVNGS